MMAEEWFYWADSRQTGPIPEADLKAMAEAGTLRPEDLIWNKSTRDWLPAGQATDWKFGPAPQIPVSASPQQPPHALSYVVRSEDPLVLSPRVVDLLRQTRPWVKFIAILTYISAGLLGLVAIVMIGISIAAPRGSVAGMGIAIVYVLLAILYSFPASYLYRFASRTSALVNMRRNIDLEEALDAQRAFWKFCGVLAIIALAVYLIGIGIAIAMR